MLTPEQRPYTLQMALLQISTRQAGINAGLGLIHTPEDTNMRIPNDLQETTICTDPSNTLAVPEHGIKQGKSGQICIAVAQGCISLAAAHAMSSLVAWNLINCCRLCSSLVAACTCCRLAANMP